MSDQDDAMSCISSGDDAEVKSRSPPLLKHDETQSNEKEMDHDSECSSDTEDEDERIRRREAIAAQFMLPERRAKVKQLVKEENDAMDTSTKKDDGHSNKPAAHKDKSSNSAAIYCYCRSTDISRFMIGCDFCDEWYHGDCILLPEKVSSAMKKFACDTCRATNADIRSQFKQKDAAWASKKEEKRRRKFDRARERGQRRFSRQDQTMTGVKLLPFNGKSSKFWRESVKETDAIFRYHLAVRHLKTEHKMKKENTSKQHSIKEERCPVKEEATNAAAAAADDENDTTSQSTTQKQEMVISPRSSGARTVAQRKFGCDETADDARAKCLRALCPQLSRDGSRYCSDECGVAVMMEKIERSSLKANLARMFDEDGNVCTDAAAYDRRLLEATSKQIDDVKSHLALMEDRITKLHALISAANAIQPLDDNESEINSLEAANNNPPDVGVEEADALGSYSVSPLVYCCVCGKSFTTKLIVKHWHRCFAKYEAQFASWSRLKAEISTDYPLLCDFYTPNSGGLYCKRLRHMCPDHCQTRKRCTTDANDAFYKPSTDAACGFPLKEAMVSDVEDVTDAQMAVYEPCRLKVKDCQLHPEWRNLRLAQLDIVRLRDYTALERLLIQKEQLHQSMAGRPNIFSMIMNTTIDEAICSS